MKKIKTEDLGKIFEMAICLLYKIEYNGVYKYSLDEAKKIKKRINNLQHLFPHEILHISKNKNKYDFISTDGNFKLNAKTTKRYCKVCPQVIGQPTKKTFCSFFNIDLSCNLEDIKIYIEKNVKKLLMYYIIYTFECPIIYYNKHKDLLMFVELKKKINWLKQDIRFTHKLKNKKWNESSSIKIKNDTIGEFQIHNKRNCIKFRWNFEKLLKLFMKNFNCILL
jgi:hypothetical protein